MKGGVSKYLILGGILFLLFKDRDIHSLLLISIIYLQRSCQEFFLLITISWQPVARWCYQRATLTGVGCYRMVASNHWKWLLLDRQELQDEKLVVK